MTDFERNEFDVFLTAALQARPDVRQHINLADAAIARAIANEARMARLTRMGVWMRRCSLAAGLLIVLILATGIYLYPASATTSGSSASTATTVTDDGSTNTADASTTATSSLDMTSIGALLLAAAVVGVALKVILLPDRPAFRLSHA